MAQISPTRPSRRVAQRARIIDSSDEETGVSPRKEQVSDDEGFTSSPQKSPHRPSRRKTATASAAALDGQAADIATVLKSAPKPRRNVRTSRRSHFPITPDVSASLPTPSPSKSPEPTKSEEHSRDLLLREKYPLSDITKAAINETVPATAVTEKLNPTLVLQDIRPEAERPMDIVIRVRAKAIPVPQQTDQAKPRMVLTYLVLNNFKSYAGKQEVGPFHASFSSVVGPNGSGKSNVIDSLLFVFGFRASKMRQGKISALIHNSAAHPDLDFCEVAVHFQEVLDQFGGNHEVIPDSQIVVSRKAFKNNSSKYYINGSESTFTTVTKLLRDRGIDLDHKRFLILQGEVESIAQMKPKAANDHDDGLLEYLEDIIGTSKYKTPIEESAAETETLNEVCVEKNNRVSHVERERRGLESKKDVAIAYMKDENELAVKQSALYQIFVAECADNIQVTAEAVEQFQCRLGEETEKHSSSEQEIKALQKQYNSELKQFENLELSTQATVKQLTKSDKDAVKFEERRKHLNAKLKKLEKTVSSNRAGLSDATAHFGRLMDDLERNGVEMAGIETRLQAEERELASVRDSLKGKTEGLSEQVSKKQELLEPWTQQIGDQESAIALAKSELAILREKECAGEEALSEAKAKLVRLQQDRATKIAELDECRTARNSHEARSQALRSSLESLSHTEPDKRAKLSVARQKADEARASLSKSLTQGNVLSGLTRLKESGRIDGFHGRLGDLGAIDAKYDVSISTACPTLDNLVVDSVEVGQQCIEYLRKNNLGRANFILLDRLGQRDITAIETPEGAPRLFDLVKAKHDKFRPAFYNVLQNTLVAKDMEQAHRIAYGAKRWRVVTLDGQLIDKSGTMSGGGTKVAKGAMSSKLVADTSKEQVEQLDSKQEELEQHFQEFQRERQDTETAIRQINDKLPEMETRIQRCSLEVENLDRTIADVEKRCMELSTTKRSGVVEAERVGALEASISSAEKEIDAVTKSSSGIKKEIQTLQDKIMEIGGVKLRAQKAKVDGLREQTNALTEEISNAEVLKAKSEKQGSKHEKTMKEAQRGLEVVQADLERLNEESQTHGRDASAFRIKADQVQEALDTMKEALEALKAAVEEKTAEINSSKAVELEMRNELEEHQKILHENQKRMKYWEEKLSKLVVHDVSDLGEEFESQNLAKYTRDELSDLDKDDLKGAIAILEERTQNFNVELSVLAEYRRRVEEHAARSQDLVEAVTQRDAAKRRCEELRRLRLEGFMEGFSSISLRLKEMYQMITMGGNAELELVDSLDPFSEGILFSVMPPKKSWKNISNLSGGEKTLSSLALVFALHHYKPTPLYVMDEIDAALDFRNVSIVASYIKERTKNAQFIVISLRNNMFELASRLVGVYKVNQMASLRNPRQYSFMLTRPQTKSVTVENRDYIERVP